ncbi:MAG: TRAP transporter substrate-binding protein DctP [Acidaminococcales bacterium]|nr:TRAP transporter substrate-binding protein DctP [Acidaminococcales bacterium]
MTARGIMALLLGAVFLVSGCGGGQKGAAPAKEDGKVYKVKVADAFPATHFFTVNGLNKYMKMVEERSNGRIKFEHYPGGQLGKQVDMIELVKNGVADMAVVGPSYVSGKVPLSNVFDLPGIYSNSRVGAEAFWHLSQGILYDEEFKKHKIRPVYNMAYNPNDLFYNTPSGKFIINPADVKGMRFRVPGVSAEMGMSNMGGAPVSREPQEMYEAVLRGTVDGCVLAFEALDQYKMQEVIKLATKGVNMNGWIATYCVNERFFAALPPDLQKLMLDCGLEATINLGDYVTKVGEEYQAQYEKGGMKVYTLNAAEQKAFRDATNPVVLDWVKTQSAKGLPAQKVLDATRAKVAEVEKSLKSKK